MGPFYCAGCSDPLFQPLEQASLKMLAFKTILLLSLGSSKQIGEIHTLPTNRSCMKFSSGSTRVTLRPNTTFILEVLRSCCPVDLESFYLPPFSCGEQQWLLLLCSVRLLSVYVERTKACRKSDQLFVSCASQCLGLPVSKQRLSLDFSRLLH